jgi:hypothetical protein
MKPDPEEMFQELIQKAPVAVQSLFADVKRHFEPRNDSFPHHTRTNKGDLRLAVHGELLGQKRYRNFVTMCWVPSKNLIKGRTFLSPEELRGKGFTHVAAPNQIKELLNSDFHLRGDDCSGFTQTVIDAFEAARLKFMQGRDVSHLRT